MKLPSARASLLVRDLTDEVLIYDQTNNKSYCLNSTARTVFNACDGKKTFADLNLPEDIIHLSLDELKRNNLIADAYISPFARMNRREVIKKVGLSSMIALPLISGLVAPRAIQAGSGAQANGAACTDDNQCQSNRCGDGIGPFCCSANLFETCQTGADCCNAFPCTNSVCCQGFGRNCDTRVNICCAGLTCVALGGRTNGTCQ